MTIALIAFDGSENAMRAVEKMLDTVDTSKLHAHVLNVCEPIKVSEVIFKDTFADMQAINKAREEEGLALMAPAKARLESAGIKHDLHIRFGDPAETITEFARAQQCNIIVIGTRGLGVIKNLLLGSVASKVLHLTEIPILLVK
ncbi:universal stress protein [Nitrosomonas sp. HPC101]|uniref:universal stress protein n=1 Tax=Nitrosomonas sp. HPC101 TaxID=1658667 RepID=UPI001371DEB1|nr:universal stress protein [Nitrosomonas sp. HPC101]MXS84769.1 universal stress protein [Nitrosomonas sp. HPC101]